VRGERSFERAEQRLRSMCIPAALQLYEKAERAGYESDACAGGRWICHMLLGDFAAAWRESDAIAKRGNPDPHRFWDGRSFEGQRVLIRCLHGLGDTIHFIRYARLIRERALQVIIEAQPTLKLLIEKSRLADTVITWGDAEPAWDQQIEVVELPRIFRTRLATIPTDVPYLGVASESATPQWDGTRPLRVGVVWASSSYNALRSIPLRQMARLFDTRRASFFSLQAGEERLALTQWSSTVTDLYDESACVMATAVKLKALDLVITVDTMVGHLAGAMARPVWTLLPFQCDWRWMIAREDSPWYPTMRLFRQARAGDWKPVIDRVQNELEMLIAAGPYSGAVSPACASREREIETGSATKL
jgi:hypothetical protein